MVQSNSNDVLAGWETSSQYWNKHQALIERMFAPLTRALVEDARIGPGQSVLDIGGGSGEPSLTIARIVGSSGQVTYTDPAAGMVNAARDEAQRRELTNIQFLQAPAENLPFPENNFDASIGRLSVMFIPDVVAGLREVLRVTKPEGRASFLVWAAKEVNPFFQILSDILNEFVPAEPENEDAPAAFRFARPGKLATLFKEAGASDVTERTVDFQIEAPIDIERFWELRTEMSDTFRNKLKTLTPERIGEVKTATEKAVAKFFETGIMSFPAQVLVITGKKAGA